MTMRKLYIIVLKVFLIIVFSHLKAISDEKIKIGLIIPLSGEYSYIGNSILKSTRMALNKINDERITVIPKDTKANPIDTLKVSNELYKNGVKIIGESNILNKLPTSASNLYAKNVFNFVSNLYDKENNKININLEDEIIEKTLIK